MIKENLFDLTDEQVKLSKSIYDGKVIKCLVAPYHNYNQLEKLVTYTPTTFLFPERDMTTSQLCSFISMIVSQPFTEEIRIITTNQNIIMDMVDGSVRVFTEMNTIVPSPVKTFMANIHDIRYSLLENKEHQKTENEKNMSTNVIRTLITDVQNAIKTGATQQQINVLKNRIEYIGEEVIAYKLNKMTNEIDIIP